MKRVVLVSAYDMGRQPFGLASPAAWLRAAGFSVVTLDLSLEAFSREAIEAAEWVAFHLPMHTGTRMALPRIQNVRKWNAAAHIVCYGLYAPVNAEMLRGVGVSHIIGGEFEQALVQVMQGGDSTEVVLERLPFVRPDRSTLPVLNGYAHLRDGAESKITGYTEASRGCKHLCRHCPIVPVYNGSFRVVQSEVVLADIRQQVAAGATHISFGDPDFLNGPRHAQRIVEALHAEFPGLTYDVIVKVEHLLRYAEMLPLFARTGCSFITSAVESLDDAVLERLDKGHTRADFVRAVELVRLHELRLAPTFVTFTPWTTKEAYLDLLRTLRDLDLIGNVAPIQLAIRLLIPAGSRLLELDEVRRLAPLFNPASLAYPWVHPDPEMDLLCRDLQRLIRAADRRKLSRPQTFALIWERAFGREVDFHLPDRSTIPYLTEPWYC